VCVEVVVDLGLPLHLDDALPPLLPGMFVLLLVHQLAQYEVALLVLEHLEEGPMLHPAFPLEHDFVDALPDRLVRLLQYLLDHKGRVFGEAEFDHVLLEEEQQGFMLEVGVVFQ